MNAPERSLGMEPTLLPASLDDLAGLEEEDCAEAFACFLISCRAPHDAPRPARPPSAALQAAFEAALAVDARDPTCARTFFVDHFTPHRVVQPGRRGFLTGYYQPRLRGSLRPSARFPTPVLARPDDLVTFRDGERPAGLDPQLSGGRRLADGAVVPYPDRAAIEDGAASPVLWLEDPVELFKLHPGRYPLWHVKDLDKTNMAPAEVGTGVVDFKRIFDNAKESGMKYFFVEQDQAPQPLQNITGSYNYLEKLLH